MSLDKILYSMFYILNSVSCIFYFVFHILYCVSCIVYPVFYILYCVSCILYSGNKHWKAMCAFPLSPFPCLSTNEQLYTTITLHDIMFNLTTDAGTMKLMSMGWNLKLQTKITLVTMMLFTQAFSTALEADIPL